MSEQVESKATVLRRTLAEIDGIAKQIREMKVDVQTMLRNHQRIRVMRESLEVEGKK